MEHSFEAMLVEHCAPTLAGIKPASLFRFQAESLDLIRHSVQVWDQCFEPKGIRVQVLMECPGSSVGIIYVYREKWVMHLLAEESRSTFLEQMGYRTGSAGEMLAQLSRRLCLEAEYPHEIGIFLGYPKQGPKLHLLRLLEVLRRSCGGPEMLLSDTGSVRRSIKSGTRREPRLFSWRQLHNMNSIFD